VNPLERRERPWKHRGVTVQRGAVNVEDLAAMQLFAELEPEERERVAALSEEIVVPEGETIDTQPNFAYEFS